MKVDIFTSHVGYLPRAEKRAVVADKFADEKEFVMRDYGVLDDRPFTGRIEIVDCDRGKFGVADFPACT